MTAEFPGYAAFHQATEPAPRPLRETDFDGYLHLPRFKPYLTAGKRVLDIGCGSGALSRYAASCGATVTALDVVQPLIERLQAAIPDVRFACADVMNWQSPEPFDVVILSEVLEHLPDDRAALTHIHAMLRPDGMLLLSVPTLSAPLHRRAVARWGYDPQDVAVGHLRRYSWETLQPILVETGFAPVSHHHCEGLLRNWLYNAPAGRPWRRWVRGPVVPLVSWVDRAIAQPLWGASDLIVIARRRAEGGVGS